MFGADRFFYVTGRRTPSSTTPRVAVLARVLDIDFQLTETPPRATRARCRRLPEPTPSIYPAHVRRRHRAHCLSRVRLTRLPARRSAGLVRHLTSAPSSHVVCIYTCRVPRCHLQLFHYTRPPGPSRLARRRHVSICGCRLLAFVVARTSSSFAVFEEPVYDRPELNVSAVCSHGPSPRWRLRSPSSHYPSGVTRVTVRRQSVTASPVKQTSYTLSLYTTPNHNLQHLPSSPTQAEADFTRRRGQADACSSEPDAAGDDCPTSWSASP